VNQGKEVVINPPEHCGIDGNEEADKTAKSATNDPIATEIEKLTIKDVS